MFNCLDQRYRSRTKRSAMFTAAALMIAWCMSASQARAQTEMTIMYGGSEPRFSTQDLEVLFRTVTLSPDQSEIITGIHAGYSESHRAVYAGVIEQATQIGKQLRSDLTQARRRALARDREFVRQAGREQCRDLEVNFANDIKALLDESQIVQYQRFERDRRRRLTLRVGPVFQGENIDLVALADAIDPAARATIDATLEGYAIELDPILLQRNRMIDRLEVASMAPDAKDGAVDLQALWEQARPQHLAVRDLNWRWMDQIAGSLDHAQSLNWQRRFLRTGWPNLLGATRADETFDKAQRLLTLTQNQREIIEILRSSFREQITPVERQVVEIEREHDKQTRMNPGTPAKSSDRMNQLLNQRELIVDDFIIQVHGILSPTQKTELQATVAQPSTFDRAGRYENPVGQYALFALRCPVKEDS